MLDHLVGKLMNSEEQNPETPELEQPIHLHTNSTLYQQLFSSPAFSLGPFK